MENRKEKYLEKGSCTSEKLSDLLEKFQLKIILSIITEEIGPIKDYYDNIIVENLIRNTHSICKIIGYQNVECICMTKKNITVKYGQNTSLNNIESLKLQIESFNGTLDENNNSIYLKINYNVGRNYAYI